MLFHLTPSSPPLNKIKDTTVVKSACRCSAHGAVKLRARSGIQLRLRFCKSQSLFNPCKKIKNSQKCSSTPFHFFLSFVFFMLLSSLSLSFFSLRVCCGVLTVTVVSWVKEEFVLLLNALYLFLLTAISFCFHLFFFMDIRRGRQWRISFFACMCVVCLLYIFLKDLRSRTVFQ